MVGKVCPVWATGFADELHAHENEAMLVDLYRRWSDLLAELGETEHALEVARRAIATRQTLPA